LVREDIGRHNAVDKVIGRAFLDRELPLASCILLVSGRSSFEIMQKALSAGIPIVASVSAPSTLAMEFARECNQTLIGFLRPPSFNIYAHIERVILD
jgi:FdhD protein